MVTPLTWRCCAVLLVRVVRAFAGSGVAGKSNTNLRSIHRSHWRFGPFKFSAHGPVVHVQCGARRFNERALDTSGPPPHLIEQAGGAEAAAADPGIRLYDLAG